MDEPLSTLSKELSPPWLDLPNPLAELILERLPLPDYIRFGAVCPKWQSIQKQHRIHHSPFPPPMHKSLPWLLPDLDSFENSSLGFYTQTDSKLHFLDLPDSTLNTRCIACSQGWFINIGENAASLLNIVSKSQIKLPPLMTEHPLLCFGALSVPPLYPDCVALVADISNSTFYMSRVGENHSGWSSVGFPQGVGYGCDGFADGLAAVYYNGKFYCRLYRRFFSVETNLIAPSTQNLNMDCSEVTGYFNNRRQYYYLVESSGDLLLVVETLGDLNRNILHECQVYKADFCKMTWIKMNSLGDRALFITDTSSLSVIASDMGCKSNCVYYANNRANPNVDGTLVGWRIFDMNTMQWTDGPHLPYKLEYFPCHCHYWLLPSL